MDARAAMARDSHRLSKESEAVAARHRAARDQVVRQLRGEDPGYWTLGRLACHIGCSRELIYHIIKTARREVGHDEVHGGNSGPGG